MHYWDTYYSFCFTFLLLGLGIKNINPITFLDNDISPMIQRSICVFFSALLGEIFRNMLLFSLHDIKIFKRWFIHLLDGLIGWYLIANNLDLRLTFAFKFMSTNILTGFEIIFNYNHIKTI